MRSLLESTTTTPTTNHQPPPTTTTTTSSNNHHQPPPPPPTHPTGAGTRSTVGHVSKEKFASSQLHNGRAKVELLRSNATTWGFAFYLGGAMLMEMQVVASFVILRPFTWSFKIDCATFRCPIGCGGVLFHDRTNPQDISPQRFQVFFGVDLAALAIKFLKTGPGDVCPRASRHWTRTSGRRGETEQTWE